MRFRKLIALFLSIIMLMSFSTMFVSANTRSINYPQSWVNVGETIQLSISGNASATWSSSNSAIATVSSSGKVTGVSRGNVTITATCPDYNGSTETFYTYIDVYDNRGIVNGEEYYIMNVSNSKVLSLASSSTANNTGIVTSSRGTSNTKKWKLTQKSTGKYTFVSMYNSTTKGMYANISTNDVYLYTVGSSATHFEIERVNSGTYQGLYRIRYNGKYLSIISTSNDVCLSDTLNAQCYWSLSRVDKGNADFFTFDYTGYDTTENTEMFQDVFDNIDFTANSNLTNEAASTAYTAITEGDIFVFRGHANAGIISFYNYSGISTGAIAVNSSVCNRYAVGSTRRYIENISNNGLSSLRVALYIGCNSGKDITIQETKYNLVKSTYEKGAHFVLGTKKTLYSDDNDAWLGYFLEKIEVGDNILNAILYATLELGEIKYSDTKDDGTEVEEEGDFPAYYMGDTYQYFN